jgi:hypothetical protein
MKINVFKNLFPLGWLPLALLLLVWSGQLWAATPNCPSGYNLEADGTKCVKSLRPTCPAGYNWSAGTCRTTVMKSCPQGMSYITGLGKCASYTEPTITCPSGYTYWSANKKCRHLQIPDCPSGFHWSATDKKCVRGTEMYPAICPQGMSLTTTSQGVKCVSYIEPTINCPSGYTYWSANKKCRLLKAQECPSGFHWSIQDKNCVKTATPSCPPGSSYNAGKAVCEEVVTPHCAEGYTLNRGECTKPTGIHK